MGIRACNTRILIDEFDFSGDTQGVKLAMTVEALDANTLQTCARKAIAGNPSGSIEQNGYWAGPDAGDIEHELNDRLGTETPVVVSVLFDTRALGNPAYVMPETFASKVMIEAPFENLLTIAATWDGITKRGLAVAHQTFAAAVAATGVDYGAQGTLGGWAALHVRAIVGSAHDATFVVESDDNSGFTSAATEGTFTVSAVGATIIDLTGTIDRYIRLRCTDLGGATSIAVTAIVGVAAVTG
jgi:hypothetical protein